MSEALRRVEKTLTAHRRAQQRERESLAALHDAIRDAVEAGERQVDIVRITGYSRERIRLLTTPPKR